MASTRFAISLDIEAPAESVHRMLCDLQALRVLHPLIDEVQDLPRDPGRPEVRHYRVTDRVPWGPWHMKVVYTASLWVVSPSEIRATAKQFPGVRLETTYRLCEAGGRTRVDEAVHLTAPRLLCRWIRRMAESAHREMLGRLKTHLEATR